MIRKSSRSLIPKKTYDEYLCIDQIILDNHPIIKNQHDSNKNNTKTGQKHKEKVVNIAGNDILELRCLLDQQSIIGNFSSNEIPIIYHCNQYQNKIDVNERGKKHLNNGIAVINNNNNSYHELSCNTYIATLESLIEIDIINVIKRILINANDIWSLCPAKIADEIESYSRKPLTKTAKRMIECMVIAFTHQILINTQMNCDGKIRGFIGGEIVKAETTNINRVTDVDFKYDDAYDEVESNCNYDKNHFNQISIKNKFNRFDCDMFIAWRTPINPIKYINNNNNSNIFNILGDNK